MKKQKNLHFFLLWHYFLDSLRKKEDNDGAERRNFSSGDIGA